MTNTLRIDHKSRAIVMDKLFAKNSSNVRFKEYNLLQRARHDYPTYEVVVRHIKRNPNKETYRGLTYDYMESYILSHESPDTIDQVLNEYKELHLISKCHCKARRYPTIKKWFLQKYPAIVEFGMPDNDQNAQPIESDPKPTYKMITPPLFDSHPAPQNNIPAA